MANISDVAKMAGVSRTAVSFAFNDASRISKETAARIHAAAEELGYYPNPAARRLITKRADVLGLLIPQQITDLFANPFFASLLRGIGHVCDRYNFAVLLVPPVQGSLIGALRRASVDGFIVVGLHEDHPAIVALRRRHSPFVTVDGPTLPHIPAVNADDYAGAFQAAKHLLGLGHREVLVVSTRPAQITQATEAIHPFSFIAERRLAGYRAAFDEAGVPFREEYVIPADTTHDGGQRALRTAWLAGARPTAVLAMSDITALGVMAAARDLGLSVPADLSVIGFDDIPAALWCDPRLTTVNQGGVNKGMRAARLLIDCQLGNQPVEHLELPTELVVRGTTASPPSCPAAETRTPR
jgi:DNA-binding LacI/PurR family transcriptional regulator